MLGELVPQGGGDPIPLLHPELLVGRQSTCDLVLSFPNVSSQHCELLFIDGFWKVRDLNSRNGVFVNGERVSERFVHPGDLLTISRSTYQMKYESTGDAPPEEDPFTMSLMEKAGLEKRQENPRKAATPLPPPSRNSRPIEKFDADEDAAMDWLMGD